MSIFDSFGKLAFKVNIVTISFDCVLGEVSHW